MKLRTRWSSPLNCVFGWSFETIELLGVKFGWIFYLHLGLFHLSLFQSKRSDYVEKTNTRLKLIKSDKEGK